jgi:hypothetical protein
MDVYEIGWLCIGASICFGSGPFGVAGRVGGGVFFFCSMAKIVCWVKGLRGKVGVWLAWCW